MKALFPAAFLACTVLVTGCSEDSTQASATNQPAAMPPACDADPETMTTSAGVAFVRTPDACFEDLKDWPYDAKYVEINGLRQAYVDAGPTDGPVVLLLHGQPSWSYLYRKMIPVLVEAGLRVIAMDHLGMGRSDKPTDITSYSYLGHYERLIAFMEALSLRDIHLFAQDWGSLLGLRAVGLHPDKFASVAIGNGNLLAIPAGTQVYPMVDNSDEVLDIQSIFAQVPDQQVPFADRCEAPDTPMNSRFGIWMEYAMKAASFHASEVLEAGTWFPLTEAEEAAYDAPFPSRVYMAGPRSFPSLVNELPGVNDAAVEGLYAFDKPFITIWGGNDSGGLGRCSTQDSLIINIPGAHGHAHTRLMEAGHFLQDDQGQAIAERLVRFLTTSPIPLLRGGRYCEIGIITVVDGALRSENWSSAGLHDCPQDKFEAIDTQALQNDTGAVFINMNGPRAWVPNSNWMRRFGEEDSQVAEKTFGELLMHRVAVIDFPEGSIPNSLYNPIAVTRSTTFIYKAGEEIYELTDPEGTRYFMQSLNQQDNPAPLDEANLASLASQLTLPEGWTYTARTLDENFILRAEGYAYVLRDDLGNTYQRFTEPESSGSQTLAVLEDGTGTACTSDADCAGLVADHCLLTQSGFCTVQPCQPGGCGIPYVCCHSCNEAVAAMLPFEASACIPIPATSQLEGAPGCTCE
ncbi:MAG: haloalkane dehalogenase [Myxococcota bacterium]|nr:haloalkane dehalogenase [Myxococcota bacterium]